MRAEDIKRTPKIQDDEAMKRTTLKMMKLVRVMNLKEMMKVDGDPVGLLGILCSPSDFSLSQPGFLFIWCNSAVSMFIHKDV